MAATPPSLSSLLGKAAPFVNRSQPPASQKWVVLGVVVGCGICAVPLMFSSVRKREQSVADMRDANGKDDARNDRLKAKRF
mmetsp:Transcript_19554/g.48926  ORF Transcript_19554/g.48926 Transcript_19554/m.48926 type:complete len:81 (+) Transcript_19554:38-280(+)